MCTKKQGRTLLTIEVRVMPRSGRSMCTLNKQNKLKCFLKSAPEHGKANEELIKIMAKACKVPRSAVTIVLGKTSRTKTVRIACDYTYEQLLDALGIARQQTLV